MNVAVPMPSSFSHYTDDCTHFSSRDDDTTLAPTTPSTSASSVLTDHGCDSAQINKISIYVEKFVIFCSKNVDSILNLAHTIVDAECNLNNDEFSLFLQRIKLHDQKSTLSRMRTIGRNLSRFDTLRDRLPPSWTTIYKLAKMSAHEFDSIKEFVTPFATAKDIEQLIKDPTSKAEQSFQITITLDFNDKSEILDFCHHIQMLSNQFNFSHKPNKSLNDYLSDNP